MPAKTPKSKGKRSRRPPRRPVSRKAKRLAGNPFSPLADTVRKDVETRLRDLLDARLEAVGSHGGEVVEMVSAIRDLCLRGGKRLRPALLVAGYRAANARAPLEPALDAGVSLELLQAYFLIHDDWMDQDAMRRGGPSVHALLAKRLRSRSLGHASAILAGDYAVALASETLLRVSAAPQRLVRCAEQFAKMQSDAVIGQQLDIVGKSADIEAAYALKTGSYTVRGPLVIGGILGGGSPRALQALERFAVPVGVAFQLRDDLLSAFGDPEKTGKPFGNDLKQGKRTVLLQAALRRARGRDHRTLKQVVGNRKATVPQLRRAVEVLERSGAKTVVEERITELVADGRKALGSKTLTSTGRELLEGAVRALAERRS